MMLGYAGGLAPPNSRVTACGLGYFGFAHKIWSATWELNPENLQSECSTYASSVSGGWCSVAGSNRSLALERRGVSPETQRNRLAIVVGLEPTRPRLRGALLEPLCIHDRNGGAHRNRTDQAICLQGRSGFLARTPCWYRLTDLHGLPGR